MAGRKGVSTDILCLRHTLSCRFVEILKSGNINSPFSIHFVIERSEAMTKFAH
jgi:hypothetical protein